MRQTVARLHQFQAENEMNLAVTTAETIATTVGDTEADHLEEMIGVEEIEIVIVTDGGMTEILEILEIRKIPVAVEEAQDEMMTGIEIEIEEGTEVCTNQLVWL
jgi:hypothetical protein